MKAYPSISRDITEDIEICAFDKLDGSNFRAEWNKKQGFYMFGTKTRVITEDDKAFGEAIPLVRELYGDSLGKIFSSNKYKEAVAFFEFHGPHSFAGRHSDEKHKVTLIDVNAYKHGMLRPEEYLRLFGHLDIAKLLYRGKVDAAFIESVRNGTLPGMTFEGVVCKGIGINRNQLISFKIKNRAWLEKLKIQCDGDDKLFEQLS